MSAVLSAIRADRWLRRGLILLFVIGSLALTACDPSQFRTQAAQMPRLVVTSTSDPKTFNYITSDESSSSEILSLMYDGLLSTNGMTGELEPGLAESWQISPDQKQIVYKLRPGLKWSDGAPLTVDDILFTYNEIIFNEKIPTSNADLFRVGEQGLFPTVRKIDDLQVEFTAPEPFAPLLRFAGGAFMPKHALEASVKTVDDQGNPQFLSTWGTDVDPTKVVGSGAYRLKSYQPGERVILERNPNYWRQDAEGKAQPYIDQFVFQFVASDDAALVQFRAGGIDVENVTPDFFALVKREEQRGNFTIYNGGSALSSQYLTFNLNQGRRNGKPLVDPIKSRWFNTLAFRQAVAHALDRPTMINNIYKGLGVPQHSAIYIQSPYYFPPEQGLPTYEYDPAQAKALLTEAGFKYNSANQLTDAEGNIVRFTMITNAGNKIREAMGTQIKQDLAQIGITVDFQPIAFNTLVGKMSDSLEWEALVLGLSGAGVEPDGGRNVWSPKGRLHFFNQFPSSGTLEGWQVADWEAEIGRLYVKGGQELNDDKRKEIYAEAQKLAQAQVPMVFLVNPLSLSAVKNRIQGVEYSALGGALWNIHELQLSQN
jgi:peptide/nickel transport system substrate-binding protein